MVVEGKNDEIIIRISANLSDEALGRMLRTLRYNELTSKFSVTQEVVHELAVESKKTLWNENKLRFLPSVQSSNVSGTLWLGTTTFSSKSSVISTNQNRCQAHDC